ncbi:hypothetical protein GCM10023235_76940 [Kitasatospora terrestris]|uniref:Uncharacterized protein n=1 Tax=Kitasatospora terrestris TaxID=258051 RepID=A0ABP9EQ32_9ACTN
MVLDQVGELLAHAAGADALEAVDELGRGDLGWDIHEQVDVVVLAVELDRLDLESAQTLRVISSSRVRWWSANTSCRYFVAKTTYA